MNDLLQLKGEFFQKKNTNRPGAPNLPNNKSVEIDKLKSLLADLERLNVFWEGEKLIGGALISVKYNVIIAKSRRISGLLTKGAKLANDSIVGARFSDGPKKVHIITHYIDLLLLKESIKRVKNSIALFKQEFGDVISSKDLENIEKRVIDFDSYKIKKTNFMKIIVDSYYIESFLILESAIDTQTSSIVGIYETDVKIKDLLAKVGINLLPGKIIDKTTVLLEKEQILMLASRASYLISMATKDLNDLTLNVLEPLVLDRQKMIPNPTSEPIIGVIDTMFDTSVYFSEWVKFEKMISDDIPLSSKDFEHGTAVSSIIVDGPSIFCELDDGCGRFRVRHFGVATGSKFSSFLIMQSIKQIIASNLDIKVWNLSLGSNTEVNLNSISIEAALLDKIQYENDVVFIVSGTNKNAGDSKEKRIGSPADSINSIVVNSVDFDNKPAVYSRKGIVLSFFNKPDVSFYGGTRNKPMKVCGPNGEQRVGGTSYAAPWIARKMSYLIDVLGLSREAAKAILLDSATGWSKPYSVDEASLMGHGVVPKRIEDIINAQNDEIKFVLTGESKMYDTYNYNIAVPVHKEEYPFVAKATMCYIPKCSRAQGVDYTNTELDIHFGRIDGKGKIKSINDNVQSIPNESHYLHEDNARKQFRKWDNSKHIRETFNTRKRAKKTYDKNMWGISIKTKERLVSRDGVGIKFGVVVTLKEIKGVNRIDDFIRLCSLRGWLVNKINIESRIDIYNVSNEDVILE